MTTAITQRVTGSELHDVIQEVHLRYPDYVVIDDEDKEYGTTLRLNVLAENGNNYALKQVHNGTVWNPFAPLEREINHDVVAHKYMATADDEIELAYYGNTVDCNERQRFVDENPRDGQLREPVFTHGVPAELIELLRTAVPYQPEPNIYGFRDDSSAQVSAMVYAHFIDQVHYEFTLVYIGPDMRPTGPRPIEQTIALARGLTGNDWPADLWDVTPAKFGELLVNGKLIDLTAELATAEAPFYCYSTGNQLVFELPDLPSLGISAHQYYSLNPTRNVKEQAFPAARANLIRPTAEADMRPVMQGCVDRRAKIYTLLGLS